MLFLFLKFLVCRIFSYLFRHQYQPSKLFPYYTPKRKSVKGLVKNFSELQTDKKPVVLFDRIDNKTDEHISGLDVIADRILTDLLDTEKFAVVDKRARDVIPEELRQQSEAGAYLPESKVEPVKRIAPNYFLRGQIVSETQENKEMVVKSYFIRLNIVNIQTGLTEVQSNSEVKKVEAK